MGNGCTANTHTEQEDEYRVQYYIRRISNHYIAM